jgi:hypothetical protein
MTVEQRMSDMLRRHGPNSPNALAHPLRERYIRAAATRVAERLRSHGMTALITRSSSSERRCRS